MQYPVLRPLAAEDWPEVPVEPDDAELTTPTSVTDKAGLQAMSGSGHYSIDANIDCTGAWTPIANFSGVVEGNGHTISNLTLSNSSSYQGLFANFNTNAKIQNLKFSDCSVECGYAVGVLCGRIYRQKDITIKNVTVSDSTISADAGACGALIGYVQSSGNIQIWDCVADSVTCGVVNENAFGCGGLLGFWTTYSSTYSVDYISYCGVTGESTIFCGDGDDYSDIGGFAGLLGGNANYILRVYNCYVDTGASITIGSGEDKYYTGGFCGDIFSAEATTCRSAATITVGSAASSYISDTGGFAGNAGNTVNLINCYSTGTINITQAVGDFVESVGGFCGSISSQNSEILRCYSTGNITINNPNDYAPIYSVGGFVGFISGKSTAGGDPGTISRCYTWSDIIVNYLCNSLAFGGFGIGGFAGGAQNYPPTVSDCYCWGSIAAEGTVTGYNAYVGGFIGSLTSGRLKANWTLTNCYCAQTNEAGGSGLTGQLYDNGNSEVGGFLATDQDSSYNLVCTQCFFDTTTSSVTADASTGAVGHVTSWIMSTGNLAAADWDLDNIWYTGVPYVAPYEPPTSVTAAVVEVVYGLKENAHFVDCTPTSGEASVWNSARSAVASRNITMNYVSTPASRVYGIPFTANRTILTLDADGEVRDVGGGKVGFPCKGHPFKEGQYIVIGGSDNYYSTILGQVLSDTTASEIVVTATYIPETFDGTETVIQAYETEYSHDAGRMAMGSDGYLYVLSEDVGVTKLSQDMLTETTDFLQPATAFPSSSFHDLKIEGDYLYLVGDAGIYNNWSTVYKFSMTDGSEIWRVNTAGSFTYGYEMDVDSSGNVYVANHSSRYTIPVFGATPRNVGKYDTDDGALEDWGTTSSAHRPTSAGVHVLCVDMDMTYGDNDAGVVISGGDEWYVTNHPEYFPGTNIHIRTLDNSDGTEATLGDLYALSDIGGGTTITGRIPPGGLLTYSGYIYALVNHAFAATGADPKTIYKLDSSLNVIASTQITSEQTTAYPIVIAMDSFGNLVVILDNGAVDGDGFLYYDTDLNYISKSTNIPYSIAGAGNWQSNDWVFPDNVSSTRYTYGTTTVYQTRTVAYPQDYSNLEGETCQVLADGAVHPDVVITNGTYELNGTYDNVHIGLQYTSKLQPMKVDGELYQKRIGSLFMQLVDTLGGQFGEEEDKCDSIPFRKAGDAMDDSPDLFTGHKLLPFPGSYNRRGDIWVKQIQQLPMKLIGLCAIAEVNDGD